MRFQRSDLPGIAIAVLAPPLMMLLFFASFETWDHRGSPLLGQMAVNVAAPVGIVAAFSRYIRSWDVPVGLLALLVAVVAGVNWAQRTGNDDLALVTALKWVGVLDFLLLNVVIGRQVLINGVLPILDRRDARRAAAAAAANE